MSLTLIGTYEDIHPPLLNLFGPNPSANNFTILDYRIVPTKKAHYLRQIVSLAKWCAICYYSTAVVQHNNNYSFFIININIIIIIIIVVLASASNNSNNKK